MFLIRKCLATTYTEVNDILLAFSYMLISDILPPRISFTIVESDTFLEAYC